MNSSYAQANIAIEKVIELLRKFLIKEYGLGFDDQYVKLRNTL